MSKLLIFVSATIVLIFTAEVTFASPSSTSPNEPEAENPWPTQPPDENLQLSTPPQPKSDTKPPDAKYYPYRQALTFRGGMSSDFPKMGFDETVIGFQYLFPKFLSPKLEAGADLQEEDRGHLHIGLRWIAWERNYFRPSGKISLDHLAEAEERLATVVRIDNYYVRLSGTIEYVIWNPYSIRLEHELLANLEKTYTVITLGISRGW